MDFLTPIVKTVWPILKKYWPFFVIFLLCVLVGILMFTVRQKNKSYNNLELERQRWAANAQSAVNDTSEYVAEINLLKSELNQFPYFENEIKRLAKENDLKESRIKGLHKIISSKQYSDSIVIIRDTVYTDSVANEKNSISFIWGCSPGTVTWITGDTVASVNGTLKKNIDILSFKEKNKGHSMRDFKRFWTFKWKLIGTDKWNYKVKVIDNCDSLPVYEKNIKFEIK